MKKIYSCIAMIFCLLAFAPISAEASTANTVESTEVRLLSERLVQISNIDKSKITVLEKKQLRKEVRSIKGQQKAMGNGGIYLSVGAIIIIILLLIILL